MQKNERQLNFKKITNKMFANCTKIVPDPLVTTSRINLLAFIFKVVVLPAVPRSFDCWFGSGV